MRRREFITLLGGILAAPSFVHAQQSGVPVIGFLRSGDLPNLLDAFRQGLKEGGYVEGQNVAIEYHSAQNRPERLPILARELIAKRVALIAANGIAAVALSKEKTTIPLVFMTGADPVQDGLVTSLNRPGGNATGITFLTGTLGAKRLELFRELLPGIEAIGFLTYPGNQETHAERGDVEAAARTMGQKLLVVSVGSEREFESAFATFVKNNVRAVMSGSGAFLTTQRLRLIELADRHKLPIGFGIREGAAEGGLMSYGTSQIGAYRQGGLYAARILNGEKPGELPVMQGTKFELVINMKTAKALGIQVPTSLLVAADEVIE